MGALYPFCRLLHYPHDRGTRPAGASGCVPAFDDLVTLTVRTADRDERHGPFLPQRDYEDEAQCAINRSPSPLLKHYPRAKAYRRGEKPKEFTFLGMTFFCGKTRHGAFKVKRKTSRKKLRQALARFTDWIRRYRNLLPTGELLRRAKVRVQGHLNYYAITDNSESCHRYRHLTRRVLFKWLNRRSQRKSYTWAAFQQALRHVGWPQVRIRVNLNPFATLNA